MLITLNKGTLLDGLLSLSEDKLDVARVGHVGVDTTVSTVSASAALRSLVDLDVLDNKVASVKTLGVGVGLGVLQEVNEELGGLLGPAGLADTELLALGAATGAASEPAEGDSLELVGNVLEESKSTLELHAVDGLSGLTSVLEADAQIRAPGAGALSGRNLLSSVTDHLDVVAERGGPRCRVRSFVAFLTVSRWNFEIASLVVVCFFALGIPARVNPLASPKRIRASSVRGKPTPPGSTHSVPQLSAKSRPLSLVFVVCLVKTTKLSHLVPIAHNYNT